MGSPHNNCPAPNAVIDVGTNTLRLLIGCVHNGKVIKVAAGRFVSRLGKDLLNTKMLSDESISKSISSLHDFKALCEQYNVKETLAVGTSALRDAKNSREFLESVREQTGLEIRVISGREEAELTLKGVTSEIQRIPSFIVDVGGGSTEWILYKDRATYKTGSIQLGAVRIFEAFIKSDPPSLEEIKEAALFIKEQVTRSLSEHKVSLSLEITSLTELIATGGTATTVASIALGLDRYDSTKVHMHTISYHELRAIFEKLRALPLSERAGIKGLEAGRVDIIVPGVLILLVLMEILKVDMLGISDYGLLEGLLLDSFSCQ